jgi:biotin carboxyl carrier protein
MEVPISGKITGCDVNLGDSVKEGDTICTIEAMKMDNAIMAPHSGKVIELKVKLGMIVESGDIIAVIEY